VVSRAVKPLRSTIAVNHCSNQNRFNVTRHMSKLSTPFDWAFWFQWVMGTTLGWFLGGILLPGVGLVPSGIAIGFFQWMVLIQHIKRPWRWALVSAAGWMFGWLIGLGALPLEMGLITGLLLGLSTGLAQWFILRREYHWTGWWIAVSAVAWMSGLGLFPGIMLSGIIAGVITGTALEILFRTPKPVEIITDD